MKKNIFAKTAAIVGIGTVIVFVLNRFLAFPTWIEKTYIYPGVAFLAAFAAAFGPIPGALIGFISHLLVDLTRGEIWWRWATASSVLGFVIGFLRKSYGIQEGKFGITQALVFNIVQISANILSYIFFVNTPNLFREEYMNDMTMRGFVAAAFDMAVILIFGTLILFFYSKNMAKNGKAK